MFLLLVNDKPIEETPAPSQPAQSTECPYPLYQPVDNWTSISWYYINSDPNALQYQIQADATMMARFNVEYGQLMYDDEWTTYFINGCEVVKMTVSIR